MKILAVTTTRADYGIMSGLFLTLQNMPGFEFRLAVTGNHLSDKHGFTLNEILSDGIEVSYQMPFSLQRDDAEYLTKSVASLGGDFGNLLSRDRPDLLLILGDRYEIMAPVFAAVMQRIPIAHIHGGEETRGAMDNKIRHAVTQLADYHFVATSLAADRIKSMCPDNQNIYHVGSLSLDRLSKIQLKSRAELENEIGLKIGELAAIVTFHPETLSHVTPEVQVDELISALRDFPDLYSVITSPNADAGFGVVSERLRAFANESPKKIFCENLGHINYLSCLANFDLLVGNSSSGIIEAPFFGIPSVDIGERQAGREKAKTVISVPCKGEAIANGISKALETGRFSGCSAFDFPYGKLGATDEICGILGKIAKKNQ